MVHSRTIGEKSYSFGISGRLYKSNVLLYDHQTESLWSQLMQTAVSGPMAGKRLTPVAAQLIRWQQWKKNHPRTKVLSEQTGHARNYDIAPYENYHEGSGIFLPVGTVRPELTPKSLVLGLEINGRTKAYPMTLLQRHADAIITATEETARHPISENPDWELF